MNKNENQPMKYTIVVACSVLVIVVLYSAVAYATNMWPFKVNDMAPTASITPVPSKTTTMGINRPTVDKKLKVIQVSTNIDTKEQGNCTLTLSNEKHSYELKNSTVGIKNKTGCLNWNIGISSVPAGTYDVKIDFVSKSGVVSTAKSKVIVP